MDKMHPSLVAEYQRWLAQLPSDGEGLHGVSAKRVLQAHFLIADYFAEDDDNPMGFAGPRDLNLLLSAVDRQHVSLGGQEKWTFHYDKLATLFFGLVKNHAFHDGNKRTAFLIALDQLIVYDRTLSAQKEDFEELTVRTAASELDQYPDSRQFLGDPDWQVRLISHLFQKYTRKTDHRLRSVTFRQLKATLRSFGYTLDNPNKNYIDVIREEDEQRVAHIGFPGWSRQVAKGDVQRVREATGLTRENGYDAQVLFEGADHIESLIDEFREPLLRLADS